jgi:hypothetical protein
MFDKYPELVFEQLTSKERARDKAKEIATALSLSMANPTTGNLDEGDGIALVYCFVVAEDLVSRDLEAVGHKVFSRFPFSSLVSASRMQLLVDTGRRSPHSRMSPAVSKLYSRWAVQARDRISALIVCLNSQNPVAAEIARQSLKDPEITKSTDLFELSMQSLARYGTSEDVALAESFLDDKTSILEFSRFAIPDGANQNQRLVKYSVQSRDLALATSLLLLKDDPFDWFETIRLHQLRGFVTESLALEVSENDIVRTSRIVAYRNRTTNGFRRFPRILGPEN